MEKDKFYVADKLCEDGHCEEAFNLFMELAELGDTSAMTRIAIMYSTGEGVDRNINKSIHWDMKAIEFGNVLAMHNIGITYKMIGNLDSARSWFDKSIDAGNGSSVIELLKLIIRNSSISNEIVKNIDLGISLNSDEESISSLVVLKAWFDG